MDEHTRLISMNEHTRFICRYGGCNTTELESYIQYTLPKNPFLSREDLLVLVWRHIRILGVCQDLVNYLAIKPLMK